MFGGGVCMAILLFNGMNKNAYGMVSVLDSINGGNSLAYYAL